MKNKESLGGRLIILTKLRAAAIRNTGRALYLILPSVAIAAALFITGGGGAGTKVLRKVSAASTSSSGAALAPQTSGDLSIVGKWELQQGVSTVDTSWAGQPLPIHISLLPNGKLLFWGRDKRQLTIGGQPGYYDLYGYTTARVWDPFYKIFTNVDLKGSGAPGDPENSRTNLFCSSHSFLPDGRLLVAGGHRTIDEFVTDPDVYENYMLGEGMGSANTNIFDFRTNTWSIGPVMNKGRWYPFNVTLANGETLIVSGSYFDRTVDGTNRVSTPQNTIPQIFNLQGGLRNVRDLATTWPYSDRRINNYPLLTLLSNGKVLVAATLNTAVENFLLTPAAGDGGGQWEQGPNQLSAHFVSTAVLYQKDKILIPGGVTGISTGKEVEAFELQPNGMMTWTARNSMTYARQNHTATILPDGKVLVVGGTPCNGNNKITCNPGAAIFTPELWDPQTGLWTRMAQHQEVRVYHSTAILLPDARVLVGGGGQPMAEGEYVPGSIQPMPCLSWTFSGPNIAWPVSDCRNYGHHNVEIFSPPYLFLAGSGAAAPRPAITYAPKEVTYGQTFMVEVGTAVTPGGSNITAQEIESAVLIRLGSVTHGFNQDQRRVPLTITSRNRRFLTLTAPANGAECPPGHYMLFVMKRNGDNLTPSVAKIIRVNSVSTLVGLQAIEGRGETRVLSVTLAPHTTWEAAVTAGSDFITGVSITQQNLPAGSPVTAYNLRFTVEANPGQRRWGEITLRVSGKPSLNQVITIYQGRQFADVPADINEDTASKLDAMKITSGCGDNAFCPNERINRGELAVFLVRAAINAEANPPTNNNQHVTPPPPQQQSFSDVLPNHPFYWFIEDLLKRGITGGCGAAPPGQRPPFCPEGFVTRAELAAFAMRALGIVAPNPPPNPIYTDLGGDWAWARAAAEEARVRKIMMPCTVLEGSSDRTESPALFCPSQPVSRADVATVLARIYGY